METHRDYTIRNGLGIRVRKNVSCQVIRLIDHKWVEIGQAYDLPLDRSLLIWTETGIPASILAVALRVYELDNPDSRLRGMLLERRYRRTREIVREAVMA